jgi:Flp pilus assembly protein TadG
MRIRDRRSRFSRSRLARRGGTLIEFTLMAFLLMLVLFTGIELDRMLFVYTNLADAAKAGTRYAIVRGGDRTSGASTAADPSPVVNIVKSYVTGVDPSNLTVTVTYPDSNSNALDKHVNVLVQYNYDPWAAFGLLSGVTLSASSQGVIVY